jgi:hypothetical protein
MNNKDIAKRANQTTLAGTLWFPLVEKNERTRRNKQSKSTSQDVSSSHTTSRFRIRIVPHFTWRIANLSRLFC